MFDIVFPIIIAAVSGLGLGVLFITRDATDSRHRIGGIMESPCVIDTKPYMYDSELFPELHEEIERLNEELNKAKILKHMTEKKKRLQRDIEKIYDDCKKETTIPTSRILKEGDIILEKSTGKVYKVFNVHGAFAELSSIEDTKFHFKSFKQISKVYCESEYQLAGLVYENSEHK